ncbi:MAG: preprotein translocase subunit YajC [Saprospiraceae bacterium]|jgi:preprotein translocase subunit YajC|nr:preprotein translocase subunit YajC [Saprospiraceae bacterium]MBK7359471.1 preprotein translocase subunit YajC [Saprospiraceae bacterium]MBK7737059.1 preprotein translocase subunit YajC [Saprospiraceae bacterium]MBK7914346.1 preprotein translocase subunit YajC [Saprospiraceae bacterium]MBK8296229.1 preprotein translocase subunit YajC [Saprospiraceae bacterium]
MSIIILYVILFGIMYVFFILPKTKQQKAQNLFITEIKKGDQVVTQSGIIGRITKIDDLVIELQLDSKSFIKVLKSSISKEASDAIRDKYFLEI